MSTLNEKCGVFGVYGHDVDVARLTYYGLSALQHRGQESSGIVTSDGSGFYSHIGPGLVAQVYTEEALEKLKGFVAIGHNRYATSGGKNHEHAQPVLRSDDVIALAHNGNLPSVTALKTFLLSKRLYKQDSNDSEMMTDTIRYWRYQGMSMVDAIKKTWPMMTGAFSCVMASQKRLIAFRDRYGIRPLSLGRIGDAYIVASETCAFDIIGATLERDINPGELIEIHDGVLTSHQIEKPIEKLEIFEYIYFARPDSELQGQSVNQVRRRLGANLAKEAPVVADVVIPVPDSSIPAAIGYAAESGIPFDHGLIKNRYIHRTFIRPNQDQRERDVKMKLNPLASVLKGKDVIVIDDSIVRGTTTKKLVSMLREVGAKKIHLRISCPPVKYPDFYGIDTPDQQQLIAARLKTADQIREHVNADSLEFLSYKGMIDAIGISENRLCTACFTGDYPIDLLERKAEVTAV
jgi:amidophosphoribosyltransferase